MGISKATWAKFKSIHLDFFKNIAGRKILWKRMSTNWDRFGEGDSKIFKDIELLAIIGYNDFKTWPTSIMTETGILENSSMYILLNREYLKKRKLINSNGNFDFDPINDRFIIDGIIYRPSGDTNISLAYNDPMYYMVILTRETIKTGNNPR